MALTDSFYDADSGELIEVKALLINRLDKTGSHLVVDFKTCQNHSSNQL
jgi:hypothetical protein